MADNNLSKNDYIKIHNDTDYFINAIISDYGFYNDFINAIKSGSAEFEIKRRKLKRTIDEEWINIIENSLVYLDNAIRKPSKYIEEQEEVLPIELSHNITSRSLRHLSQHTDYIKKIEGDVITPSKILNVFHEETMQTYENKFINTLIQRLYIFVNKRYMTMKDDGESADSVKMNFTSDFKLPGTSASIEFNISVSDANDTKNGVSFSDRLTHINNVVTQYLNSDFCKSMGKNYIRPPVMRTNAITKNKDLYQCLLLWQFIESYDKVGYTVDVKESAEKPDNKYVEELYSTLALQYMMFRFSVTEDIENTASILEQATLPQPVEPLFKAGLLDVEVDDYNVYDTEYRKVVPISTLSNRKLSENELRIRAAVDAALTADKIIENRRIAEEKERQRIEAQRLAEIERAEKQKELEKQRATERTEKIKQRREAKRKLAIMKYQKRREAQRKKKNQQNKK